MRKVVSVFLAAAGTVFMLGMGFAGDVSAADWTKQVGTSANDFAAGVAVDAGGNSCVAGWTYGAMNGNANAGGADLVVVKHDASGVRLWTRQLGTASDDIAGCTALDASGNVYVAGYTGGGLDGNTNAGGTDLFVVKYDPSGVKQWTKQLGSSANDIASCIAVDTGGNIYVTGTTWGNLDGNTNFGECDLFLIKLDPSGVKQWTRLINTASCEEATGVATDADGNVYMSGWTNGDLDGYTSAGNADLVLVKFDPSGVKQWTWQMGTTGDDYASGVATDPAGGVYVSGWTDGGLDGNISAGGTDIFVVKWNPSGVKQWTRQMGSPLYDYATDVSSDASGNVYVSGYTNGNLDGNINGGDNDLFLVKWDTSGVKQKTWQMGTVQGDWAFGVSEDGNLNAFLSGHTFGGLGGNTGSGGMDIFVVKLTASATLAPSTTSVTIGNPVTFTAYAGDAASHEYSFWLYGPGTGNAWVQQNASSTSNTWTWTPSAADKGSNWAGVLVSGAGGNSWAGCAVSVWSPPSSANISISPSKTVYYTGNTVAFTSWATGGSGTYEYRCWLVGPAGDWTLMKDYSSDNTWSWTPSPADIGTNYVIAWARNAGSSANYEAYVCTTALTVKAAIAPTSARLTAYPIPVYAGRAVTFTATAAGGTGPYQYKFWLVSPAGAWTLKQDYSSANTWTWTPSTSDRGTNYVILWVKNTGSSAAYETYASYPVTVR